MSVPTGLRRSLLNCGIEGLLAAALMVATALFVVAFEHPASPAHQALAAPLLRRILLGAAMGVTIVLLVYSPWGRRSGAHFNPALSVAFYCLGQLTPLDMAAYVLAQFVGACAGMGLMANLLGHYLAHPNVAYAMTRPGSSGAGWAFLAEFGVSFVTMFGIFLLRRMPRWRPYTGVVIGALVALFVAFESPLSGMSMNPARTLGSAFVSGDFSGLWLYFVAPTAGMVLAAQLGRLWEARVSKNGALG